MDILMTLKQLALSLFSRRKRWLVLATGLALVLLLPAGYLLSQEPPRFRTSAVVFLESKVDRISLFQEFSSRPMPVQMALLQSRALAEAVIEALPRASVADLIANPYSRDYWLELQNPGRPPPGPE